MIYMFQNHFLCFSVLQLIFFNDIIFSDSFHGKPFARSFLFNKHNFSKSSSSQNFKNCEVIYSDLFFSLISSPECFRFLLCILLFF